MIRRGRAPAAAALLLLFACLAALIAAGATQAIDQAILTVTRAPGAGHPLAGPRWGLPLAVAVTTLGAGIVRAPLTIAAALLLLARRRTRDAALLAGAVAGGAIVLPIVKALFHRARPDTAWRLVAESHASFPSGHAMGSMILYPLLGLLLGGRSRAALPFGIAVAIAVGVTRVLLGVHWASDVLGGWLLGGGCALAVAALRAR